MDMYFSGNGDDLNSRNELYTIYLCLFVHFEWKRHNVKYTFCLPTGGLHRGFDFQLLAREDTVFPLDSSTVLQVASYTTSTSASQWSVNGFRVYSTSLHPTSRHGGLGDPGKA